MPHWPRRRGRSAACGPVRPTITRAPCAASDGKKRALNNVAEPLVRVEQDSTAGQVGAIPHRLIEIGNRRRVLRLVAVHVAGPPFGEIPFEQQGDRHIPAHQRLAWSEGRYLAVHHDRLVEAAQIAINVAEIVEDLRVGGKFGAGLLEDFHRFLRPGPSDENRAEIGIRAGEIGRRTIALRYSAAASSRRPTVARATPRS